MATTLRQAADALRSVVRFRPLELNAARRRLERAADIADLRRIAKRRLPGGVFDYIDGGAEAETTMRRNAASFERLEFRPRVLRDMASIDISTTLLGRRRPSPLILAPTGFTRIADPLGELAVAPAAARAGIPYTLSTMGTRSIEEVTAASDGDHWFQVYVWRDKGLLSSLLDRASAAGMSTIVITVDTAVLGRRERDVRRGFSLPPRIGMDTLVDGVLHPAWTLGLLRSEPILFANVIGSDTPDGSDPVSLSDHVNSQFDRSLSWDDIAWFQNRWDGSVVLKGVQSVEDAVLAVEHGVDAIALSNHGGRQLDGAPPPIELVAPVRQAVGDRIEVICDGGMRRGSDVVKAMALGASACMVGRPYLYGLGAAGEAGVDHALGILLAGIERTLALIGVDRLDELDAGAVRWRTEGGRRD